MKGLNRLKNWRKIDPERHMPPGLAWQEERNFFLFGLCAAAAYSMQFFLRFSNALNSLYGWDSVGQKRVLLTDAVMVDFAELFDRLDYGFYLLALCMIAFILRHYWYHWQGAKSIYLMRRLPSRWELHRRCLTLPLCGVCVSLAAAALILLVYFGIYMSVTPEECLSGGQWMKIWR